MEEISLSPGEIKLLKLLIDYGGSSRLDDLPLDKSKVSAWAFLLRDRGIVEIREESRVYYKLTERGLRHLTEGLPEEKLIKELKSTGGEARLQELKERLGDEFNVAVGEAKRKGLIEIGDGKVRLKGDRVPERKVIEVLGKESRSQLDWVDRDLIDRLKKRGLVEEEKERSYIIVLTELGKKIASGEVSVVEEIGKLTRDLIITGEWKKKKLKRYDLKAEPPRVIAGKPHPYLEFLEEVREILIGMGFVEVKSPIVEAEFWNFDVLFQAQDHPAREVHDSYQVRIPSKPADLSKYGRLVEKVSKVHENGWITGSKGWGYKWSFDIARRLMLRSQMTAASARSLASGLPIPYKIFAIDKVFRPETPDKTHAIEFHQCEGVVLAENMSVRHLMGFLAEFAKQLGFDQVKFRPAYFPFTEPSVEAYVKHPELGWIEIAGSGMFRPEMMIPLGYDYPRVQALAWGIGIGRLAMMRLGIDDIRELHSQNLEFLRNSKVR